MAIICVIEFDNNPYGIYFAGQTVTGKVTFQTEKVKKIKAVTLKFTGYAHTNWSESKSSYTGHENYMESVTHLMKSTESTNALITIEPGTHSYNFSCQIPNTCPSSFEGLIGHIRYTVTVSFVRPWMFDDTFTRNFTVSKVLDLNYGHPKLYELVTAELSNTFGFGSRKTDPLKINVSIPQSGYIPGQIIPIDVLINNESDVNVEELKYSLLMHIQHFSQMPSRTETQQILVIKSKGEGVRRNCSKKFKNELLIPATPPTCVNLCGIIKITYELQVEAKIKGLHANQVVCIPITIGNIPPSTAMQQQSISIGGNVSSDSNTVDEKLEYHLVAESGSLGNINANSVEIATCALQEQSDRASIPPPNYDDAVQGTITQQIDESRNEMFGAAMLDNSVNLSTAIFEEAAHLIRANPIKNAYVPRYPVFRNVSSQIESRTVEYNEDSACKIDSEKR